MPSDSSDQQNNQNRRPAKAQTPGAPPPEQEHLPCPRCDSATTATPSLSDHPIPPTPVFMNPGGAAAFGDMKGNVGNGCGGGGGASFTSLLNTQGPGFLALGGFGLGLANGFEEMGFGLGRAVWPFPGVGDGGAGVGGNGGGHGMMNTWQFESGEGGGIVNVGVGSVGGEFCSWPELAISTPGNGLK
ncbi:PREDICTED: dof zinc finger protein DOF3.4 [Prunus mume]|uniref:Dof zinc finger protein DOF3.4 n=1 Tax=Prunus mume TaxID=102107 RepID=A0ABM0PMU3_PRUMU|nr:PREDICTED: dof zinc finger protein DOF3.4 [Prunus mume]